MNYIVSFVDDYVHYGKHTMAAFLDVEGPSTTISSNLTVVNPGIT